MSWCKHSGRESQVPDYLSWIQGVALSRILGPEGKGTNALNVSEGGENIHFFFNPSALERNLPEQFVKSLTRTSLRKGIEIL